MNNKAITSFTFGAIFIICGLVWTLSNVFALGINWKLLWPSFILLPSLFMWITYFSNRKKNLNALIPANLLLFIAITMFVNMFVSELLNYNTIWVWTVFMYPASVAAAFWITWWIGGQKEHKFVIPAGILSLISLLVFCSVSSVLLFSEALSGNLTNVLLPLLLICFGLFVLLTPVWTMPFVRAGKQVENTAKKMEEAAERFADSVERSFNSKPKKFKTATKKSPNPPFDAEEAEIVE